ISLREKCDFHLRPRGRMKPLPLRNPHEFEPLRAPLADLYRCVKNALQNRQLAFHQVLTAP
ncbi:MAG: hypothetical protein ACE5EH_10230, partial [Gammaproteobacteria bacterium]